MSNCVGTYEAYKNRLLAMKPNVYLHGKKIDRSNGKGGRGARPGRLDRGRHLCDEAVL